MPSSATITTFYTFTAGTKARASQVNNNFSVFRGHSIPVTPDTVTASDNTYDLGSTEYRWRNAYLGNAPYINGIQTTKIPIDSVIDAETGPAWVDPQDDLARIAFPTDTNTGIIFSLIVPPTYTPGNQIGLDLYGYLQTSGATVFQSTSRLYRPGTDPANSVPAAVVTTSTTLTMTTAGTLFEESALKLSDSSGLVNGVTITVGDLLSVRLDRLTSDASDTNSGSVYLLDLVVDLNA